MSPTIDATHDGPSEAAPLLDGHARIQRDDESELIERRHARKILLFIGTIIVAVDFGSYLSYAPQVEILEQIICKRLHGHDKITTWQGVLDPIFKSDDVQAELALLVGWMSFWNQVPGILLALPYGFAADRYGRKPVLLLSLIGLILEEAAVRFICWNSSRIAVEAIWAMPLFQILGGGPQIATSMAFTMISDVFPLARRSSVFFVLSAAILLGEILATPLSAFAMSWTPWCPFLGGLVFEIIGLASALAITETMPKRPGSVDDTDDTDTSSSSPEREPLGEPQGLFKRLLQHWPDTRPRRQTLEAIGNTLLVTGSFFFASIGKEALQFVVQYASKRFSWTIAQASLLITIKGVINLVMLLLILPQISSAARRYVSALRTDLLIVYGSVCLLALGTAIMAFAGRPGIFAVGISCFALGWGYYSALRSLATALVLPTQLGAVNTAIALSQSFGAMLSGPVLAFAFRRGVALDGMWVGLPYMVASLLFVAASLVITGIRLPLNE